MEPSRDAAATPEGAGLVGEEPAAEDEPADIERAAFKVENGFLGRCVRANEDTPTALYLRRRGYTGPVPDVLRSANSGDPQDGKLVLGLAYREDGLEKDFLPAMVAEIAQPDGTVAGVHVTYLRLDGSGKADVPSPKKMHGIKKGGAVRLTAAGPVLAVTEGIETGLSILEARPHLAVWAAVDAGNMRAMQLPDGIREVLICADNDASCAGQKAAQAAADRWVGEGRKVSIALPPEPGTDFNDVLLQDGVAAVRALLDRADAWRGVTPHYDVEPMSVESASAAMDEAIDAFVANALTREAIEAEVRRAQAVAEEEAVAANPDLDPEFTIEPEETKRLLRDARRIARNKVLQSYGLRRLPHGQLLQVAAGAGIGKTAAIIRAIAARDKLPFVVHYYVPTHALADGLAERFRQAGVRAHVIRGRTATSPDGSTMCRKPQLAQKVGAAGLNVKKSICKNESASCEHYGVCPFMRQVEDIQTVRFPTVLIMPHNYLTQPKPGGMPAADFAVIDESVVQSLLAHAAVPLSELHASEHWRVLEAKMAALSDFLETGRKLGNALKGADRTIRQSDASMPPLSEIEQAAAFAREVAGGGCAELSPAMDEPTGLRVLSRLKPSPRRSIAQLYELLAFEMALERDVLHGVEGSGNEVRLHWRRQPKPGAEAVLIIDADADESIGRVLWGGRLRHLSLPVRRNAIVTQVTDATFSKSSLIDLGWQSEKALKTAERTLERVSRFIGDCVTVYGSNKVLVVANKPVRCALTGENQSATLPAAADLGGAAIAHFGNIRGIDTWKDYACVVIVGREQPRPEAVEAQARALYWDDPEPLGLTGAYGKERRGYRLNSSRRAGADVWVHPDARVQRVHELPRERELGQAVDRLRLVHREQPAHVYLLSSLPVDVTVDRLVETDDLLRDIAIQAALKRHGGVLPLTPEWLLEHEPLALVPGAHGDKPSERALKYAISGLVQRFEAASGGTLQDTGEVETEVLMKGQKSNKLVYGPLPFHGGGPACSAVEPWRLFRYRIVGSRGGKPRLALVAPDQPNPTAALAALLERPVLAVDEQSDEEGSDRGSVVAAVTVCAGDPRLRRRRTWIRAQVRIPRSGAPPGLRRCPARRGGARYWSGATSRGPQAACCDFLTRRRAVQ